jgi:HTH-type transcriptional regulator / antitoxin HigA
MSSLNQYFPESVTHPGLDLAEKLEELSIGPKEFAVRTSKPEKTIIAILSGKSSITPDMAVLFENVLRIPAHYWINRQCLFDEYKARAERNEILKESTDWAKLFPLNELFKKEWLPAASTIEEKTAALLSFFGFSSHTAWEDYYLNQQLKVAFRLSLAHTKEPHALSAWLRRGELQAEELETKEYNEKDFKVALTDIKSVMANHPDDCFKQLQNICKAAGVKVVHTPCLPKAPISGSTRWVGDTPLIQLTGRYNRNDVFWFTFFHEAGHIILHGKKDIFLESIEYSEKDLEKEKQADAFAIKWTFSEEEEEEILQRFQITDEDIIQFAAKFKTNPAIIVGRLQHKGFIRQAVGRKFIKPVEFE